MLLLAADDERHEARCQVGVSLSRDDVCQVFAGVQQTSSRRACVRCYQPHAAAAEVSRDDDTHPFHTPYTMHQTRLVARYFARFLFFISDVAGVTADVADVASDVLPMLVLSLEYIRKQLWVLVVHS